MSRVGNSVSARGKRLFTMRPSDYALEVKHFKLNMT